MEAIKNSVILAFIIGEVTRQRHDVETSAGAARVIWMATSWDYAMVTRQFRAFPTVRDVYLMGKLVEPGANFDGLRKIRVTVNGERLPEPEQIPRLLEKLWEARILYTPDEFYVEFERVHPFVDGNGRTGKILHNWILGKLEDPVLVADYFGRGVP